MRIWAACVHLRPKTFASPGVALGQRPGVRADRRLPGSLQPMLMDVWAAVLRKPEKLCSRHKGSPRPWPTACFQATPPEMLGSVPGHPGRPAPRPEV